MKTEEKIDKLLEFKYDQGTRHEREAKGQANKERDMFALKLAQEILKRVKKEYPNSGHMVIGDLQFYLEKPGWAKGKGLMAGREKQGMYSGDKIK